MEKFKAETPLSSPWYFTEDFGEVEDQLREFILKESKIDIEKEPIRIATFIENKNFMTLFNLTVGNFVVITDTRVVSKTPLSLQTDYFTDLIGVKRGIGSNVTLLSAGHRSDLFALLNWPPTALADKLYNIIFERWNKVKPPPQSSQASEVTKVCPFCAETIKKAAIVCRYCQRDLPE